MSNASFVVLIKDNFGGDTNKLTRFLKEQPYEGILYRYNHQWLSVLLSEFPFQYEDFSIKASLKLDTEVVSFYESEDYGWGFHFYYNGSDLFSIDIEYDNSDFEDINNNGVHIKGSYDSLGKLLSKSLIMNEIENSSQSLNEQKKTELLADIKDSINIGELADIRFDNFSHFEGESTFIRFGNMKREINVKKIILKMIDGKLKDMGLSYIKKSPFSADYSFLRKDNGYYSGIDIFIDDGDISFYIKTHLKSYDVKYEINEFQELAKNKYRHFNSESHLKFILSKFFQLFLKYGLDLIKKESIIPFDVKESTDKIINLFNLLNKYEKVFFTKYLTPGGKMLYSDKNSQMEINFHLFNSAFTLNLIKDNNSVNIREIIEDDKIWISFRNNFEYENELTRIINILIENKQLG
jgi:hypothetical protein